jgi:hypothetical protein
VREGERARGRERGRGRGSVPYGGLARAPVTVLGPCIMHRVGALALAAPSLPLPLPVSLRAPFLPTHALTVEGGGCSLLSALCSLLSALCSLPPTACCHAHTRWSAARCSVSWAPPDSRPSMDNR